MYSNGLFQINSSRHNGNLIFINDNTTAFFHTFQLRFLILMTCANLVCRNDADVMGPPSSLAFDEVMNEENGSQPATQPLSDSQGSEIEEQSSMSQDDLKVFLFISLKLYYFIEPLLFSSKMHKDIL